MASLAYSYAYRSWTGADIGSPVDIESIAFGSTAFVAQEAISPPVQGFPISIAGRNYMVDTSFEPYRREAFRHKSLQPQRQSLHFTNIPDDGTVSTEGLWRREARDWSLGSGQQYFDRKDAADARFYHSKGVNPWTQWQLSLLPDVKSVYTQSYPLKSIRAGAYVYVANDIVSTAAVSYTTDWSTFTTPTGLTGNFLDMCSDGYRVYVVTTTGVWQSSAGSSSFTRIVTSSNSSYSGGQILTGTVGSAVVTMSVPSGTTTSSTLVPASGETVTTTGTFADGVTSTTVSSVSISGTVASITLALPVATAGTITNHRSTDTGDDYSWTAKSSKFPLTAKIAYVAGQYLILAFSNLAEWRTNGTSAGANIFYLGNHATGKPLAASPGIEWIMHQSVPSWVWTDIASASTQIYFCGHSGAGNGSIGRVYRTALTQFTLTNSTTLTDPQFNAPVPCLPLPEGEYPTSMCGYLNYIFLGTNKGIRMCETLSIYDPSNTGGAGDLKAGPIIPSITETITQPVTGIVGNDRYVYWTWNNYDSYSTGLGRLDLTKFVDVLAPAYASDLMVGTTNSSIQGLIANLDWDPINNSPMMCINNGTGTATATVIVTRGSIPSARGASMLGTFFEFDGTGFTYNVGDTVKFTIDSHTVYLTLKTASSTVLTGYVTGISSVSLGTYTSVSLSASYNSIYVADSSNCVQTGTVDSGLITFGIPDNKNAVAVDINIANTGSSKLSSLHIDMYVDNNPAISVGDYAGSATKYSLANFGQQFGEQYRLVTTLNAGKTDSSYVTPTLNRWTLKALPGIPSGTMISAVILLYEPMEMDGQTIYLDPYNEYAYLESLRQAQTIVDYVEGPYTAKCTIDLIDWLPERRRNVTQGGYHGDMVVYLKTVAG